jgi:hypothetical protein
MNTPANFRALCTELAKLARRDHYTCEDTWYSCPQSEDGSANDNAGSACDCGAEEHNAKVDAIYAALAQVEPQPELRGAADEELEELFYKHAIPDDDGCEILTLYDFYPAARAVLQHYARPAIELVPKEPTNEELCQSLHQAICDFPPTHPDAVDLDVKQYEVMLEIRKARAVLARWGRPVVQSQNLTDEELLKIFNENDWNYISPETFVEIARAVLEYCASFTINPKSLNG